MQREKRVIWAGGWVVITAVVAIIPAMRYALRRLSRRQPATNSGRSQRTEDIARLPADWVLSVRPTSTVVRLALAALMSIALAEVITAYVNPLYGVIVHSVLLVVLLTLSVLVPERSAQTLALALTIAPVIRILSLGIPLGQMPRPFWYVLTGVPLFFSGYLIIKETGLPRELLALRLPAKRYVPVETAVVLSGIGLGVIEWHILRPAAIVDRRSLITIVAAAVVLIAFTGVLEEFLFRGLIQGVTSTVLGENFGWAFTAVLFAILHVGWHSLLDVCFVLGVGLYFGYIVRHTQSLVGVSLAHGVINTMLFLVLPLAT